MAKIKNKLYAYVCIGGFVLAISLWIVHCYIQTDTFRLYNTLKLAGRNKQEMQKALEIYPKGCDKYKAMVYLIKYMPWHSAMSQVKNGEQYFMNDIEEISADYLIENVEEAYETWQNCLWKNEIDFRDFCRYILPYSIDREPIVKWRLYFKRKYAHLVRGIKDEKEAFRVVYEYLKNSFKVTNTKSPYELDVLMLDSIHGGNCRDRAIYMTYVMRSLGIAAVTDFTPFWANQGTNGHFWVSMVEKNGKIFTIGKNKTCYIDGSYEPCKYTIDERKYIYVVDSLKRICKVYRYTYDDVHKVPSNQLLNIPEFLHCSYALDVTSQYHNLTDKNVLLIKTNRNEPLYVCTYQQQFGWKPVGKAERLDDSHIDIGPMIHDNVVIVAAYKDGTVIPRSNPFLVCKGRMPIKLVPDKIRSQRVCLYRKYGLNSRWINRWGDLIGTIIETSNVKDFSRDVSCLYEVKNMPVEKINILFENYQLKRYLRFLPAKGKYPVPAEIDLIDKNNKMIQKNDYQLYAVGKDLVGDTIPLHWLRDRDPTTTFYKQFPYWIGIDIKRCKKMTKGLQVQLWNDCNRVAKGHNYELFYFDYDWHSLGQQRAVCDSLSYTNVPQNALLLLRDYTKGKEERVFIYKNGKQFWW